jgi:hypothetical protein
MSEPTVLKPEETKLLEAYRKSSKPDQDFILIQAYFLARKCWTPVMQHQLTLLAALCATH